MFGCQNICLVFYFINCQSQQQNTTMIQNDKIQTVVFKKEHAQKIASFQIQMAKETENLDMDINLVTKAVNYLYDHPELGFYLVRVDNDIPFGSLLLTFQNPHSWWIQSVYVQKPYRRQGNFTKLFREACKIAKQRGAHSIKLYAVDENSKAIAVYEALGMHINGERFYTYDFVYGKVKLEDIKKKSEQKSELEIRQLDEVKEETLQGLADVLNKKQQSKNTPVGIYRKGKLLGVAYYFTQYSQWRFGLIYYIDSLFIHQQATKEQINEIHRELCCYLAQVSELKKGALRYIFNSDSQNIAQLLEQGEVEHYNLLKIEF